MTERAVIIHQHLSLTLTIRRTPVNYRPILALLVLCCIFVSGLAQTTPDKDDVVRTTTNIVQVVTRKGKPGHESHSPRFRDPCPRLHIASTSKSCSDHPFQTLRRPR